MVRATQCRKDGSEYVAMLSIIPTFGAAGDYTYCIVLQTQSGEKQDEVKP